MMHLSRIECSTRSLLDKFTNHFPIRGADLKKVMELDLFKVKLVLKLTIPGNNLVDIKH